MDILLPSGMEQSNQDLWSSYWRKVIEIINKYIPMRNVYSNSNAAWYTRYLKRLSNKKAKLFHAAKKSSSVRWAAAYKLAAASYAKALKTAKSNFFHCTLPSL